MQRGDTMTKQILLATVSAMALTGSALAADLPMRREAPAPYVAVPVFTWTGFYVGIHGSGIVSGDVRGTTLAPLPVIGLEANVGGFVAGGTVGYNYQFSPGDGFVVGVEGDIGFADFGNRVRATIPGAGSAFARAEVQDYFATIRGRIGYAFGPLLVYATGGAAFTELNIGAGITAPGLLVGSINSRRSLDGFTVGGGFEYALTPSISMKAEYLYTEFDRQVFSFPVPALAVVPRASAEIDIHQLKVGLNYRFNLFN
ncbi:MAG: porin [Enterovirga sp.]|jgi:outer membrane immunogenic protein|nr:porin [Enterovirga sp.]